MQYTFRPLPQWPHPVTKSRRYGHFKAGWDATLRLLANEIEKLDGRNAVIGAAFRQSDLRRDGMPRADRRQAPYMHPGVEVSFDSRRLGLMELEPLRHARQVVPALDRDGDLVDVVAGRQADDSKHHERARAKAAETWDRRHGGEAMRS